MVHIVCNMDITTAANCTRICTPQQVQMTPEFAPKQAQSAPLFAPHHAQIALLFSPPLRIPIWTTICTSWKCNLHCIEAGRQKWCNGGAKFHLQEVQWRCKLHFEDVQLVVHIAQPMVQIVVQFGTNSGTHCAS